MTVPIAPSVMVDTNILVYCFDHDAPQKQAIASALVGRLLNEGRLVLSVQSLNEFYVAATRRSRKSPMPILSAERIVRQFSAASRIIPLDAVITLRALDAIATHGMSFWDALIWAAAKENGIRELYTEDFQHNRDVEGVVFLNPFAP